MTRLKKEHILMAGAELGKKSQGVKEEKERIRKGLEKPEAAHCLQIFEFCGKCD